ncbi:MAG: hypothetical protein IJE46_06725 [Clostridia bacterium]|nr:hypothetical protein [Clostridia bacterium]
MYKFTIEYYYERYHTGVLNPNKTRTGVVYAKNRSEAISKLKLVDNNYLGIQKATFEEVEQGEIHNG